MGRAADVGSRVGASDPGAASSQADTRLLRDHVDLDDAIELAAKVGVKVARSPAGRWLRENLPAKETTGLPEKIYVTRGTTPHTRRMVHEDAVRAALARVRGTYAILAVHADEPDKVVAARNFSPLVVGLGYVGVRPVDDSPLVRPSLLVRLARGPGQAQGFN